MMILTVTMNPSIDTAYRLETLKIDDVNRVVPTKTAGGKGLNVSRVLVQLGDNVLATGLLGGHMGAYLCDLMELDGIPHRFARVAGESRVCVNILHEGNQTELLEGGPQVSKDELASFVELFEEVVPAASCVVMSGSLPAGVQPDLYARLIAIAAEHGVPALLDTSGAALDEALAAPVKPTLVKPNLTEVSALLGVEFTTEDIDVLLHALRTDTRFAGIPWVVVSMGAAGSVALHDGAAYRVTTTPIEAVNATGSGDSTIAGFAHAIAARADDVAALKIANTCGKLNAMDPQTGHLVIDCWDEVYDSVSVARIG